MISRDLKEKYKNVDLEEAYKKKFNQSAPYYDMAAETRPMKEWEEIMIKAIEANKPYEVEYSDDPNISY